MNDNRDHLDHLLAGYTLGDLSSEESAELQQLLQTDPKLLQELDRYQETLAMLPLALRESSPAANLRERLLARGVPQQPKGKPSWWVILALGFGAAIALLGVDSILLRRQMAETLAELQNHRETVAMLRQPQSRIITLQGMGIISTAAGRLVVTDQKATVVIANLMPPPPGKSYQLWGIRDGKKLNCGKLIPDAQGTIYKNIVTDRLLMEATSFMVTLEPAETMPQPTGDTVMMGTASI
jgi:anti-sigma-K factor RskA